MWWRAGRIASSTSGRSTSERGGRRGRTGEHWPLRPPPAGGRSRSHRRDRDAIGIELQPEEHDGKHRHYAGVAGGLYFTIQYAGDIPGPKPDALHDSLQLCFSVADLDAFVRHLDRHAINPLHPPRPFEHTTFISLRDPDGRLLRIMTPWGEPRG
jgi:catechol 2,3-dioxygenase-like lactoylglutathione lyase family enzyme